jgi:hypothetical protein
LKWFDEYFRRFRPAAHYGAASIDIARRRAARETRSNYRDQARIEELNNLRLALAMFAVQLDMFEMQLREGPLKAHGREAGIHGPSSDTVGRLPNEK